jgi:hypothetical protein
MRLEERGTAPSAKGEADISGKVRSSSPPRIPNQTKNADWEESLPILEEDPAAGSRSDSRR